MDRSYKEKIMRVAKWNPSKYDDKFYDVAYERLKDGAEILAEEIRRVCPVGTISRPMYKTGPYAGQKWTARDAGQLKRSVRVVEKKERWGFEVHRARNVRVYVGHYLAYYARIVEYSKPFVRPAWRRTLRRIKLAVVKK